MYYYAIPSTIQLKTRDDIVEVQGLPIPIIVGFSVGPNAAAPSLLTSVSVNQAIALIETELAAFPIRVLVVMCRHWDKPDDKDVEYRGTM